jgi:3',5'-cyclic AMP phosphodiesterase CpdA
VLAVLALCALLAAAVGVRYGRQIVSFATHLKGSPRHTWELTGLPPGAGLRLAVAGDVGDSGARLDATASAMAALDATDAYDALLLLGDNVYPAGDPAGLQDTVFGPFAPVLAHARLLAVLGNHDVKEGHGPPQMAALGFPGRWWSRTFGDVLVVGLDSNDPFNEVQLAWLERTLAMPARWKIVALHHPPYSAGYQGSSDDTRGQFAPLFSRYGVQLVLSGHDHDYQRSKPLDGVTYVVSGAAAGTRRTGEEGFTAVSFSWHHFVDVTVFPDRILLRAANQDLRVADEVTIG